MPTSDQYLEIIREELRLSDDSALAYRIHEFWELYRDKDIIAPRLRYLYTKKAMLDLKMSTYSDDVSWRAGNFSESTGGFIRNYESLINIVQTEINKLEKRARSNRAMKLEVITQRSPKHVSSGLDPNDSRYTGDPLVPTSTINRP